jgi:hypothetical protein
MTIVFVIVILYDYRCVSQELILNQQYTKYVIFA